MLTVGQPVGRSCAVCVLHSLGAWSLALSMAACAYQDARLPLESDLQIAPRLFTVVFQDISDIYIEEIAVSDLALAGLRSLAHIETGMTVVENDGQITASFDGEEAMRSTAPARWDAMGWGNLTAAVVQAVRSRSKALQTAEAEELYEIVFDGVTDRLDGRSRYTGREEVRENRARPPGVGAIGVRIRLIEEGVRILLVMDNSPAERAGLLDSDIITHIDGEPTVGLRRREVVRRLRGPLRSKIELTVKRETEPTALTIEAFRAHVDPQTVKFQRLGNVALLRSSYFNWNTARDLHEKIKLSIREIGPELTGFVLDLRGNTGGPLEQAVAVADSFIRNGQIVSTRGRHRDSDQYFDAKPDDVANGLPLAVLIDGDSAAGAEIVAAALQDSGRAVVIGSSSFGQGTVQTVLRLPNEGELTLTWTILYAPSGYGLNHRGVMPDICTTGKVTSAAELIERLRRGQGLIDHRIRTLNIEPSDKRGLTALRGRCPARERDAEIDLEVAKRLLMDPELYARSLAGAL